FFFSSRRRHTRSKRDWSSDVCSSDLSPDLSLQKRVSPQIAQPGDLVTWTVTVVNIGSAPADGAVLDDPLPAALLADNPGGYSNRSEERRVGKEGRSRRSAEAEQMRST